MKKKKLIIIIASSLVGALAIGVGVPFMVLGIKTASIDNDYSYLKDDNEYSLEVSLPKPLNLKKQDVSCGYASIEMISDYYGNKVDEIELSKRNNGAITTQTSDGFLKEINKTIPNKKFVKKSYLKNDELLKEVYGAIKNENPVAIEWAAKYEDEWTLHFSVITAIDYKNDNVEVYNPYGYIENISIKEFIDRASFKAYEHLPMFLGFGFAYGAFEKNTIFYVK